MLHNFKQQVLTLLILFAGLTASAQQQLQPLAKGEGYWVIETSIQQPKQARVVFYNHLHQVLYAEQVNGFVLNIERTKVQRKLNKALKKALTASEQGTLAANDRNVVAAYFRKK